MTEVLEGVGGYPEDVSDFCMERGDNNAKKKNGSSDEE
jgi:hypothetical protein